MLNVVKKSESIGDVIHLVGSIDERAQLSRILDLASGSQTIYLNLKHVERITSAGTRQWIRFFNEIIRVKKTRVRLLECSPAIVEHINLYAGFTCGALVESFVIPFYCEFCKHEWSLVQPISNFWLRPVDAVAAACRKLKCRKCTGALQPSFIEGEYFRFIKRELSPAA